MTQVKYSPEDIQKAFQRWVSSRPNESLLNPNYSARIAAWDAYCDARDGLPPGSSKERRIRKEAQGHLISIPGGRN